MPPALPACSSPSRPRDDRAGATWRPLLLATAIATAVLAAATPGHVAAEPAPQHRFDLPSQPLSSALLAYTRVTGVQIVLSTELARGKQAPAVQGSYSDQDALVRLLAGSGLGYHVDGRTVVINAVPAPQAVAPAPAKRADATTFPTVRVHAVSGDGFVTAQASSATKNGTRLIDTPQSVSVITRKQMDDQASANVREALRYVPGVTSEYRGAGGTRYDTIIYRGMGGGVNYDYSYLDGMRLLGSNYLIPQIDSFLLDRVEVLRGPSSVLYGQGTPGGLVNLVSRSPGEEPQHEVQLQAGSHDFRQVGFDFSGPLAQDGTVLYRLTGVGHSGDSQVDYEKSKRVALAPSITWKPAEDTSLTVQAQYQYDPYGGYFGFLPATGTVTALADGSHIGRRFFDGSPSFDEFKRRQQSIGYVFDHRIDDVWSVQSKFRYMHATLDYRSVYTNGIDQSDPSNPRLTRSAIVNHSRMDALTSDNHAQASFATGAVRHTVLLGVDYQRMSFRQEQGTGSVSALSIHDPDYSAAIATPAISSRSTQQLDQLGLYAQDQMKLGRWSVLAGIRQDGTHNDRLNRLTGVWTDQFDRAFTWRLGSVYEFDNGMAPYVSYSRSFQPVADADANGKLFKPTTGEQYEAGVKYAPPGRDAFITAAVYQLTQDNALTTDPNNTNYSIQTGQVRSRGVELEAHDQLTRHLALIASYAYMDNLNTRSTTAQGLHPTYVPAHTASTWLDYGFHDNALAGLGVSGGVRYLGSSWANAANTLKVPSATLLDAAIRYDLGQASAALKGMSLAVNASNLLDKEYVSACATATKCFWGAGRTVTGSFDYRW